jgi:hypothetical protein
MSNPPVASAANPTNPYTGQRHRGANKKYASNTPFATQIRFVPGRLSFVLESQTNSDARTIEQKQPANRATDP